MYETVVSRVSGYRFNKRRKKMEHFSGYKSSDGKEFANEEDCISHERTVRFKSVIDNGELKMWNRLGRPINIWGKKYRFPEKSLADAHYVQVDSVEAAEYFFEMNGSESDGYDIGPGFFVNIRTVISGDMVSSLRKAAPSAGYVYRWLKVVPPNRPQT